MARAHIREPLLFRGRPVQNAKALIYKAAVVATGVSWSGGTATFTTGVPHGLSGGDSVVISGMIPAGYNGTFVVAAAPTSTTFTVAIAVNPGAFVRVGTVAPSQLVTGVWDSRVLGAAINTVGNPCITNAQGELDVWVDAPGTYSVVWTNNNGAAYFADDAVTKVPLADISEPAIEAYPDPTEIGGGGGSVQVPQTVRRLWVSAPWVVGSNSYPAPYIGSEGFPYADLPTAVAALAIGSTGLRSGEVHIRGGVDFAADGSVASILAAAPTAELQVLTAKLTIPGGVAIIGHGHSKHELGSDWSVNPNFRSSCMIIAGDGTGGFGTFPGGQPMVEFQGRDWRLSRVAIRQTQATSWCIGLGASQGAPNGVIEDVLTKGGLYGITGEGDWTDRVDIKQWIGALHTTYGLWLKQGTGSNHFEPNNWTVSESELWWCGSTLGNIAPTGAAIRVEGGTTGSQVEMVRAPNMLTIRDTLIFGASHIFDFAGAHSVLVEGCQVEGVGVGSDGGAFGDGAISLGTPTILASATAGFAPGMAGKAIVVKGAGVAGADLGTTVLTYDSPSQVTLAAPASTAVSGVNVYVSPIKDRPYVRVRKGPGGTGAHFWSSSIRFQGNYFHHQAPTALWTVGVPTRYDIDECFDFFAHDEHIFPLSNLSTNNRLARVGDKAVNAVIEAIVVRSSVGGGGERSVAISDPNLLFQDDGVSTKFVWFDPNAVGGGQIVHIGATPLEVRTVLTDAASVTPELAFGRTFVLGILTNTPHTIAAPLILGATAGPNQIGMRIVLTIGNTTGGAFTSTFNFGAVYELRGPTLTVPRDGDRTSICFEWSGTKWMEMWRSPDVIGYTTLVDAATVALSAAEGPNFIIPITASRALGVPTNPVNGRTITLILEATGAATLSFPAKFKGTGSMVASAAAKRTVQTFRYRSADDVWLLVASIPEVTA